MSEVPMYLFNVKQGEPLGGGATVIELKMSKAL